MSALNSPPIDRIFLSRFGGVFACIAALSILGSVARAQIVDPVVMNTNDSGPDSLRAAIMNAAPNSTITFDSSLSGGTILLTSGELSINTGVTIDGSALAAPITVCGDANTSGGPDAGDSRVFYINATGDTKLDSIIVAGGHNPSGQGGGIYNIQSIVTIQNCSITGNTSGAGDNGGGISQFGGEINLVNSSIVDNQCGDLSSASTSPAFGGSGGGIFVSNGTLRIVNSTIANNDAGICGNSGGNATGGSGGGIYQEDGTVIIQSSTITGNFAGDATTSSGTETGGSGGGIFVTGTTTTTITNSVISENASGFGINSDGGGPDIQQGSSLINLGGQNLIGNNDTVETEFPAPGTPGEPNINGDLVGTSGLPLFSQLDILADNGGVGLTRAPFFDSIVVDAGDSMALPMDGADTDKDSDTTEQLPIDQRGVTRVFGTEVDLGAVEYFVPVVMPEIAPVDNTALKTSLDKKIKKLKKKLKNAKKKGQSGKVAKFKKKIKKLQKKLKAL